MEATAQSVEDHLIESLSFKLQPGASYVSNRRSVTYHPTGGNDYSPAGVKVIKIVLTGQDWLDPSTVRIQFDLQNTYTAQAGETAAQIAGHVLRPVSGPWSLFRRARVIIGGQIVEDIDEYNRTHEMFHLLTSTTNRDNDNIEDFGCRYDMFSHVEISNSLSDLEQYEPQNYGGIEVGDTRTVLFQPLMGIFNQEKYLPVRYAPITIELELVNDFEDIVIYNSAAAGVGADLDTTFFKKHVQGMEGHPGAGQM
jgi:hypothetical protein